MHAQRSFFFFTFLSFLFFSKEFGALQAFSPHGKEKQYLGGKRIKCVLFCEGAFFLGITEELVFFFLIVKPSSGFFLLLLLLLCL